MQRTQRGNSYLTDEAGEGLFRKFIHDVIIKYNTYHVVASVAKQSPI